MNGNLGLEPSAGAVMVVGGGVAGVQAALDLAESDFQVYLVEKGPSLGGVVLQLDKTFPTNCVGCLGCRAQHVGMAQLDESIPVNDCSTCIVSHKLEESGRHRNVQILTMAEVESVEGGAGNFQVRVRRKRRNLDWSTAPPTVSYGADEVVSLRVGAIILSPGFKVFDPSIYDTFGYGVYPNVVSSLELEGILNPYGPNHGRPVRPSDGRPPKRVAWLQCVGSRDLHKGAHGYCSSVCCMYAIKEALAVKQHDPEIDTAIFFMDMRTFGKEYEEYYNCAKNEAGVRFIRSRIHSVEPAGAGSGDLRLDYIDESGQHCSEIFDMVVLSVGLESPSGIQSLAEKLNISLDDNGFAAVGDFTPVETSRPGIFACGAFAGPKDVPSSLIEGSAASAASAAILSNSKKAGFQGNTYPPENPVVFERPRVGVFFCVCGSEGTGAVDVASVRESVKGLPNVVYVSEEMLSCGPTAQEAVVKAVGERRINRVVVAGCSPRTHEKFFQETLRNAGLNKSLLEFANLWFQDAWVHEDQPAPATQKAVDLIRMAAAKAVLLEPFPQQEYKVNQKALVVGGGVSGMVAARSLADRGYPVVLVEKSDRLGGYALNLFKTWRGNDVGPYVKELVGSVANHPNITVRLSSIVDRVEGYVGNFKSTLSNGSESEVVEHGVVILATGGKEFEPAEYLYGKDNRVLTHQQLDARFKAADPALRSLESAVFIQCVGSREPERPYCSRVCCTHSMESALQLKRINPDADVYVLYRDMRTYGDREKLYLEARKSGVVFIRFSLDSKPRVDRVDGNLHVTVFDPILQREITIVADLVTLATAILPNDAGILAKALDVPVGREGFLCESHLKMRPVDCETDGVFLCGLAHFPKSLDESIAQAMAAASRAGAFLSKESVRFSGAVAYTNQMMCSSCGTCVSICPFSAPRFNDKGKAEINPALCRACGLCVASCRSGAIRLRGYEDAQIYAMIESI
ncbi:MAG: CoB--CoM heterodisulfide reductase iron-sulfur subunit A family protein [Deltaproteobacteria bacterium]|nr:CoB--CoM heterodisulfide reductase iron-sulfur subunit A family protein [Deltaproteobacteria bacterium]